MTAYRVQPRTLRHYFLRKAQDLACASFGRWAKLRVSTNILYSLGTLVTSLRLGGGVCTPTVTGWARLGLGTNILYSFGTLITSLRLGVGVSTSDVTSRALLRLNTNILFSHRSSSCSRLAVSYSPRRHGLESAGTLAPRRAAPHHLWRHLNVPTPPSPPPPQRGPSTPKRSSPRRARQGKTAKAASHTRSDVTGWGGAGPRPPFLGKRGATRHAPLTGGRIGPARTAQ